MLLTSKWHSCQVKYLIGFTWIQKTVFPIKCSQNLACFMYQLSKKEESVPCLWNMLLKIRESTSEASCCPSYRSTILRSHCGCKFSIYMRYSDLSAFNMDQHTLIQNKSKYITYTSLSIHEQKIKFYFLCYIYTI